MNKETIRRAAITARMLGYTIAKDVFNDREHSVLVVYPPHKTGDYHNRVVSFRALLPPNDSVPSDTEALGHFLVRLHMEKHYGITTEHYWE